MAIWDNIVDFLTNAKFRAATPQQDAQGVDWDQNGKPDYIINKDDKRFIACLETAQELKAKIDPQTGKSYGELLLSLNPKNPDDLARIASIEKEITIVLNDKFHSEFGVYNPAFKLSPTKEQDHIPSLHNDISRANQADPVNLAEFKKDELICRHIAPIANILLAESGMSVTRYGVFTGAIAMHNPQKANDGKDAPENYPLKYQATNVFPHTIVISNLTSNVIDLTSSDSVAAYKPAVKKISLAEFEGGAELVTSINNGNLTVFNIMPKDSIRADDIQGSMSNKLATIVGQANLANVALNDSLKHVSKPDISYSDPALAFPSSTPAILPQQIKTR